MNDDEQHDDLVTALQDALLTPGVPVLPRLDVGARFCMPEGMVESSGTWFDATVLEGGRLALVVGEVPGNGLVAAATMGQVSAVLNTALLQHDDIALALDSADLFARSHPDARGTTLVLAVVDPGDGSLTYATAGHPAPFVTTTGGSARQLDATGAGPLGVPGERVVGTHRLAAGELVLLGCTTLVRSSRLTGNDLSRRLDELADLAEDQEALTAAIVEPALSLGGADVVTTVLARLREHDRGPLEVELPVGRATVTRARDEVAGWLDGIGAPRMDALALVHATAELVTNAVEHSPADGPLAGVTTSVRATLDPQGDVELEVVDRGEWQVPSEDLSRGRGLAMAAGLVDELEVTTTQIGSSPGTLARIRHHLCRPVRIQRESRPTPRSLRPTVAVDHTGPGRVSLRGAFGHEDVDRVGAELLLASRGGTRDLVVDLTGLTDLSAGGVRLLSDLVLRAHGGNEVVLHAPAGSNAHDELDRTRVPHRAG